MERTLNNEQDLVYRLRKRAEIRRQIPGRKSVENGEPDRIADLLEEAANKIEELTQAVEFFSETDNVSNVQVFEIDARDLSIEDIAKTVHDAISTMQEGGDFEEYKSRVKKQIETGQAVVDNDLDKQLLDKSKLN